ncbi:hypothetical protein IX321_001270 [Bacteroides pyogenes]|nr:hypothetical protein [Bacteroides pyogenes]MBR8717073.1 hypothetical protein [Bacteroides pyogenes]MBR8724956.1 hypothetical protein [Bacteroides pyogenes]MBR8738495.1 hypothetical protein [Bacteroides pyogenes]MBR8746848.1 hypothetical protein [Bacteroides pyogenes]
MPDSPNQYQPYSTTKIGPFEVSVVLEVYPIQPPILQVLHLFIFKSFHFLKCNILIDRLQGVLFYLCSVGTYRIKIYL